MLKRFLFVVPFPVLLRNIIIIIIIIHEAAFMFVRAFCLENCSSIRLFNLIY